MRNKIKYILIFLSIFLSVQVNAEPLVGLDLLGLAKLKCNEVVETFPDNYALGFLDVTFGDPLPCVERILQSKKVPAFRVHLANGSCWRGGRCERQETKLNDYKKIGQLASKWQAIADKYPATKCYISGVLEHDLKQLDAIRVMQTVKANAPRCTYVQSAIKGFRLPGEVNEYHGNSANGDITSNDGENLFDSDSVRYRTSGKLISFGWIPEFNLRFTGEKTFVNPSQRKCQPRKDLYIQAARVLQMQGGEEPPAWCKTLRDITPPEIYKTNAESYCDKDSRGNRNLYISKYQDKTLDIYAKNGVKVACLKYYGAYQKGLSRHYVGTCSNETPTQLQDKLGSEWAYIKRGNDCIRINVIRRKGVMR